MTPGYDDAAAEAAAALRGNNERRNTPRPTARMSSRAARGNEMSADDLNALSLTRGVVLTLM